MIKIIITESTNDEGDSRYIGETQIDSQSKAVSYIYTSATLRSREQVFNDIKDQLKSYRSINLFDHEFLVIHTKTV